MARPAWVAFAAVAVLAGCRNAEPPATVPAEARAAAPAEPAATVQTSPIPSSTRQLVVIEAASWEAATATLRRFSRADSGSKWSADGEAMPVALGHTGLAWGRGLHASAPTDEPQKREGDGKSPAGVFRIGESYGYADQARSKLAYRALTDADRCVDDPRSAHYNRIIPDRADRDWSSAETMRRSDELYRWVVLIDHNGIRGGDTAPGAGSCIFFHVWAGPDRPTVGCAALAQPELEGLMAWLDPAADPVVVLLPRATYTRLQDPWLLP